jgi:hypothetical protein
MWNRSVYCCLASLIGLGAICILAPGCHLIKPKVISIEDRLVGSWKRKNSDVEIVLQIVDAKKIFEMFRGAIVFQGEWSVVDQKLLMQPTIAQLAYGEHLDVKDVKKESLIPTYQIVSLDPNTLRLQADSADGQPETFVRMRYSERLVGEWESPGGAIRMKFAPIDDEEGHGDYELYRQSGEYRGQWHLSGKRVHVQPTVTKLANGEEIDVGNTPPVMYRLVSVQSDTLQMDPGDGQIVTYTKVASYQGRQMP